MNAGYVYLMKCENGLYKIGKSKNPARRANAFKASPASVRLVHQIATNDMDWLERRLHTEFAQSRSHSEWFRLTGEEVDRIQAMSREDRPQPPPTDTYFSLYFAALHKARAKAGISYKELQGRTGIPHRRLRALALHDFPTVEELFLLCDALGVSAEIFHFERYSKETPKCRALYIKR